MKLSVVMPVYNESKTIREIVRLVQAVPVEKEILIVDDGSTDGTRDILRELDGREGIRVFLQPQNQGKGAAVSVGFRYASGDVVVVQDADLEYDPQEYLKLLQPIEDGHADVVYGSRFLGGGPRRVLYFWHTIGNRLLTLVSNMFTNLNLTDMETCYKMFRREVVQSLTIESPRFGIEPEITAKVARRGYRIYEVPISYYGRTYEEGKKIGFQDGFAALWTIVKHSLREAEDPRNVGHVTLARMAKLEPYNRWLVERFSAALGRRILEIGAGFGNLTRYFRGRELVIASDLDPVAVEYLRGAFRDDPSVHIASYRFPLEPAARAELLAERLDTIVCCNVLEHIEEDGKALSDMYAVLQGGGRLVLLVPALSWLYGSLDAHLRHFRRYERAELEEKLRLSGFTLEDCRFVNRPGVFGWYVNGRLLRRRILPKSQLRAFKLMLPLLRREEENPPSFGMSLLAVARKPEA
ncbi:MAG TPA: glycosyltransferase [Thermoanaerobaculia bacterium]|nr:glycosyltransferase [Thermoanaerobaculia bacterium]